MRERAKLALMARLVVVERAKRAGAEAALAEARTDEQRARDREEGARELVAEAQHQWFDYIGKAGFSPEYTGALSSRLVERENGAAAAAGETRKAAEFHSRRQSDWQALEARVRLSEASCASCSASFGAGTRRAAWASWPTGRLSNGAGHDAPPRLGPCRFHGFGCTAEPGGACNRRGRAAFRRSLGRTWHRRRERRLPWPRGQALG
jgi:hypothetical protein